MEAIVINTKKHCIGLLLKSRCKSLPFHNLEHTMEVYENTLRIGMYENLAVAEIEPILLAALFHDTGNARVFEGHEDYSTIEARNFLLLQEYPVEKIDSVLDCIKTTRMPQQPNTIYQRIICDADLYHLGTSAFLSKNELLRREWATFLGTEYSDARWLSMNIEFLQQHQFHTKYGKEILEPVKHENIEMLKTRLNLLEQV